MMNITFNNLADSTFLEGYVKMKSAIITKWYPNIDSVDFSLTKTDEETFVAKGTLKFTDAVTETIGKGSTAVIAIDKFMEEVNPSLNPVPPSVKSSAQIGA
ncbi:hypothetical protein N9W79_01955 [bacterium]|nr:hypothetical protein [bacterium]